MSPLLDPPPEGNLVWFDQVDSTNAVAARTLAALGEEEGIAVGDTVFVAARQSAGRGRGAHGWASPVGGLYATWMGGVASKHLAVLPLAVGVTLGEAVEELAAGLQVGLKWPNDLIVGGKKVGGCLCEARVRGDATFVLIGFGINIEVTPKARGALTLEPTSLREQGYAGDAGAAAWNLVRSFLAGFRAALSDPAGVRSRWRLRTVHRPGDAMRIRTAAGLVDGTFAGFGASGELVLRVRGEERAFSAGDVITAVGELGG